MEVITGSAVTALFGFQVSEYCELIYGMENGRFGLVSIDETNARQRWTKDGHGTIQSISTCYLFENGSNHILVGRENGSVEMYSMRNILETPSLVFQSNANEAITGIQGGLFTNPTSPDLICSTFSGKIISYSVDYGKVSPCNCFSEILPYSQENYSH